MVEQYLEHSRQILSSKNSGFKGGSKGSGLISLFGYQNEYDLRDGFPLLTTKNMFTRGITHELIWFLKGDTNIKYLEDNNVGIWRGNSFEHNLPQMIEAGIFSEHIGEKENKYSPDWDKAMSEYSQRIKEDDNEFAKKYGDAGPIYGAQWRKWKYPDAKTGKLIEIDQLGNVIEKMKKKPVGKKHIITAWNPGDLPNMALPSCHVLFQMTGNEDGEMDLQLYQRSCDQFLGVPFNIASYAMLTQIIAQEVGLKPRRFIHTFGDSHFYTGLEKRSEWHQDNFNELRGRVRNVENKEDYLEILEWVNKNAPSGKAEEKYDHVTAILKQLSRKPKKLPTLHIANKPFDELTFDDFTIDDYKHYKGIKKSMAV